MTQEAIIAPLTPEVIDPLYKIEQEAGDVRWTRAQFEKEMTLPMSRFFVLQQDVNILGYGGYWKVREEAQITTIVITPREQRRGWGQRMLRYLLERARADGCQAATLEVRSQNQAAQALYAKAGFTIQGRRPGAYTQPLDDALLMEKKPL